MDKIDECELKDKAKQRVTRLLPQNERRDYGGEVHEAAHGVARLNPNRHWHEQNQRFPSFRCASHGFAKRVEGAVTCLLQNPTDQISSDAEVKVWPTASLKLGGSKVAGGHTAKARVSWPRVP